jgi:hypothetical protein
MSQQSSRRSFIAGVAGTSVVASGCSKDPTEVIKAAPTPVVQHTKIGLRGYQIVAAKAGEKLIKFPHPVVRVLAVALVITAVASELVIEYLDDELQSRQIREALSEEQRMEVERQRSVTFVTANGQEEKVPLGDNRYDRSPK